jgi:HlyD family secretion protein
MNPRTWPKPVRYGVPALLVLLLLIISRCGGGGDSDAPATFTALRGPLTISVTESGTIQSRERVVVRSEVEGQTTIIWLVEEGTQVEAGDLLVQLDASALEDQLAEQEIRVLNAEAAFIRAREQLEIDRNQAQADVAQAELDHRFAVMNQTKYIEGEYPQELQSAEAAINVASEELQRARDKLAWSERLAEEGYLTRMELQADELAANRAEIDLELARGKKALLETYTHQQKLEELASDVDQKGLALERERRRTSANLVRVEAEFRAKESEYNRQQERLNKIKEQIAKCRITAPAAGMAVYVSTSSGWRGSNEPLETGQQVRERQELIYLPTASAMMAEVGIHESSLRKIVAGMPARVIVDALPNRSFAGAVRRIGLLPDAQHGWLNPDLKVYQTDIHIDGEADGLRPGMNCRAEIVIEELDDAVYVPLQAIVRVEGQPTAYRWNGRRAEPRPVEIGLDNNRMVHIRSGLEAGDEVLLNPPLEASRRPEADREPPTAAPTVPAGA